METQQMINPQVEFRIDFRSKGKHTLSQMLAEFGKIKCVFDLKISSSIELGQFVTGSIKSLPTEAQNTVYAALQIAADGFGELTNVDLVNVPNVKTRDYDHPHLGGVVTEHSTIENCPDCETKFVKGHRWQTQTGPVTIMETHHQNDVGMLNVQVFSENDGLFYYINPADTDGWSPLSGRAFPPQTSAESALSDAQASFSSWHSRRDVETLPPVTGEPRAFGVDAGSAISERDFAATAQSFGGFAQQNFLDAEQVRKIMQEWRVDPFATILNLTAALNKTLNV